ncbi:MAG: recombination-associated protein RdgC [Pseudomonadota bacterium]|nr:recombination-associated protein RdgC [Pseudomonadota bacterium]
MVVVWFKQIQVFRFSVPKAKTADDLKEALAKQKIGKCPTQQTSTYGWSSPFGNGSAELLASCGQYHCGRFTVSKRLLPLDVIRQTVEERAAQQESQQGIPVSKRDKRRMLEEVHFELLPKAFVQQKSCDVIWDWKSGLMFVSNAQQALLDSLTASLAFCVPGWMIKCAKTQQSIEKKLTRCLKQEDTLPDGLNFGDACQLADPKDRFCSIRFAGNELESQSVKQHLEDGMWVKQAQLQWQERLKFVMNPQFTFSQLKYLDIEKDLDDSEDANAKLLSELALLGPIYTELAEFMGTCFGGFEEMKTASTATEDSLISPFSEAEEMTSQ